MSFYDENESTDFYDDYDEEFYLVEYDPALDDDSYDEIDFYIEPYDSDLWNEY